MINREFANDLRSDRGIDYTELRDLLAAQKWKEANEETFRVMLAVANREEEGWLDEESIENFRCEDLKIIDQLWVKYSNGRFGFSVQKRIYTSLSVIKEYNEIICQAFGERVGWRKENQWRLYSELIFDLKAPEAHLPICLGGDGFRRGWDVIGGFLFFSRARLVDF